MELLFHWVGGATVILSIGGVQIAVDPALCPKGTVQDYFWFKSKRLEGPIYAEGDFEQVDLWLITHEHEDHLDLFGLSKISDGAKVIANRGSLAVLRAHSKGNIQVLDWGEKTRFNLRGYEVSLEAVPAIHGINPISALLAGKGNGYYLTVSKGGQSLRMYITGDTVYRKKVIEAMRGKPIDLLIPNMGAAKKGSWIMNLTLDAKMLDKMISILHPKVVIPVHYGTFEHYREGRDAIEKIPSNSITVVKTGTKTRLEF